MTAPARTEETTASPLDEHVAPVNDQRTATGRTRDGRAIAAFVISLVSIPTAFLFPVGLILGIVAVVLGAVSLADIRRRGRQGAAFAIVAIVLGSLPLVFGVLVSIASIAGGGR